MGPYDTEDTEDTEDPRAPRAHTMQNQLDNLRQRVATLEGLLAKLAAEQHTVVQCQNRQHQINRGSRLSRDSMSEDTEALRAEVQTLEASYRAQQRTLAELSQIQSVNQRTLGVLVTTLDHLTQPTTTGESGSTETHDTGSM